MMLFSATKKRLAKLEPGIKPLEQRGFWVLGYLPFLISIPGTSSERQLASLKLLMISHMCQGLNSLYLGMVITFNNRESLHCVCKPVLKFDDHPLLYGNKGSLDASTYTNFKPCILMESGFPSQELHKFV